MDHENNKNDKIHKMDSRVFNKIAKLPLAKTRNNHTKQEQFLMLPSHINTQTTLDADKPDRN